MDKRLADLEARFDIITASLAPVRRKIGYERDTSKLPQLRAIQTFCRQRLALAEKLTVDVQRLKEETQHGR